MAESRGEADTEPKNFQEWIAYVSYDWKRDSAGELRNALLVTAALFVTIAFQAGINLPPHLFPPEGGATYSQALYLAANTLLLAASMHIIHYTTASLPFRWEIQAAAWSLMFTYGCSLGATKLPQFLKYPISFIPVAVWVWRWARCLCSKG